jgi:hypothetical protein
VRASDQYAKGHKMFGNATCEAGYSGIGHRACGIWK